MEYIVRRHENGVKRGANQMRVSLEAATGVLYGKLRYKIQNIYSQYL